MSPKQESFQYVKRGLATVGGLTCVAVCAWLFTAYGSLQARIDRYILNCPVLKVTHGEVKAPEFCYDLTDLPFQTRASIREKFSNYAANLTWSDAGDSTQALRQVMGPVNGSVFAEEGARKLTRADLARRGRVVAKIVASIPYEHGIAPGASQTSYVWVDYGLFYGWRVLIVPAEPTLPISVLSAFKMDSTSHTDLASSSAAAATSSLIRPFGGIQIYKDSADWKTEMVSEVKECWNQSDHPGDDWEKYHKRACWVNAVNSRNSKAANALNWDDDITDGWIWVTEYGCVCVGSKCHASDAMQHSKAVR